MNVTLDELTFTVDMNLVILLPYLNMGHTEIWVTVKTHVLNIKYIRVKIIIKLVSLLSSYTTCNF